MAGAICGTSKEKIYQELGLETLESRRWFKKLCFFQKADSRVGWPNNF